MTTTRLAIAAALSLTACSGGAKEEANAGTNQQVMDRTAAAVMREQAGESVLPASDQREHDRMVATAQLRAKLGSKKTAGGIDIIDETPPGSADMIHQKMMETQRKAAQDRTDTTRPSADTNAKQHRD